MLMIYCHKCRKLISTRTMFSCRCSEKIDEQATAMRELIIEKRKKEYTC